EMSAVILLVEDENKMRDVLGEILRGEGYDVAIVGSGEEALERLEAQDFDVIVTDILLPGLSGLELLERSRVLSPLSGVVMITGHATVDTAIEALQKGAADYLKKPFGIDDL